MSGYTTKYLKSDDYDSFFTVCEEAGLVHNGEILTGSHNHSLILLGTVHKETGRTLTDEDGNERPEKETQEGYHANLRYKESVGLENLEIEVDSPSVVFS